jgi:hypothetical protein
MIEPTSRERLAWYLQVIRVVDPILAAQYDAEAQAAVDGAIQNHRQANWHHSFHASQFPLDPETACGRAAVYGLMGLPVMEKASRKLVTSADAGLDIEDRILERLKRAGVLLTSTDQTKQTNFAKKSHWLTGHVDAVILPPNWNRPHPLEIKSKYDNVIEEMLRGERGPDPKHRAQLMTYIFFTRMAHKALGWEERGLDVCEDGTILYVSRDHQEKTAEYFIEWSEDEFQAGLDLLMEWKEHYEVGTLPQRPKGFMWSKTPCQWCSMKKLCKIDWQDGNYRLRDSAAVAYAKSIMSDYDFDEVYRTVVGRWK